MNALLFVASLTIGQCSIPSDMYYMRQADRTTVTEQIYCSKPIISKINVVAVGPNGNRFYVPVINGYLPEIEHKVISNSTILRKYLYTEKVKYNGIEPARYDLPEKVAKLIKTEKTNDKVKIDLDGRSSRPPVISESRSFDKQDAIPTLPKDATVLPAVSWPTRHSPMIEVVPVPRGDPIAPKDPLMKRPSEIPDR